MTEWPVGSPVRVKNRHSGRVGSSVRTGGPDQSQCGFPAYRSDGYQISGSADELADRNPVKRTTIRKKSTPTEAPDRRSGPTKHVYSVCVIRAEGHFRHFLDETGSAGLRCRAVQWILASIFRADRPRTPVAESELEGGSND